MKVLVVHGSKHGGTAGIASIVGNRLCLAGHHVEIRGASEIGHADLRLYDGIVVGGALYKSRWPRRLRQFVSDNADGLRARPVWFFSSGPLDNSALSGAIQPTPEVQELMDLVGARGHITFGGRLQPAGRGPLRYLTPHKPSGDWRDRNSIRNWADGIASLIKDNAFDAAQPFEEPAARTLRRIPGAAQVLSLIAVVCAVIASVSILLWAGAFPLPTPAPPFNAALAEARGWSAVTLCLVAPLALDALVLAPRSMRARLAWAGTMGYLVYTYLEFSVSGPFTALYLVYVASFACAIPALMMAVGSIDIPTLSRWFSGGVPRRVAATLALVFATGLSIAWLGGIATRILEGRFGWPDAYASIGQVVRALDLGMLVPLAIASGVLLFRRRPSGYLVTAIWLVVGTAMGAALVAMVGATAVASNRSLLTAVPFALLFAMVLGLAIPFFRAVRPPLSPAR